MLITCDTDFICHWLSVTVGVASLDSAHIVRHPRIAAETAHTI